MFESLEHLWRCCSYKITLNNDPFSDIGTEGGIFDWNYTNEIANAESSKRKHNNESSDNNNSDNGFDPTNKPTLSNNADGGDNALCVIKLTCDWVISVSTRVLMTSSKQKPKITLELKNKTTISIKSINMPETNWFLCTELGSPKSAIVLK